MFTRKELYHATKIAYYIFDDGFYTKMKNNECMILADAFDDYSTDLYAKATNELTPEECAATHGFYDSIRLKENVEPYAYANWTILRVDNYNDENGCYAITLLPPDSDTAIIAFRGSENGSASIFINDWVVADFGLFAGEETAQQGTAMDIVENILEDERLKDYNFVLTGHSLGGNLATHCTLNTYSNRILSCTSFDGPNFAQKYYTEHADEVKMNAYKLEHMQWSLVGAILFNNFNIPNMTCEEYLQVIFIVIKQFTSLQPPQIVVKLAKEMKGGNQHGIIQQQQFKQGLFRPALSAEAVYLSLLSQE